MPNSSLDIVRKFYPQVTSVKQATKNLRIRVTRADAKTGGIKDHQACAMARACRRALMMDGAVVSLGTAYLIKGQVATRYQVPHAISREIVSFDRGSGFEPGLYTLHKPQERKHRDSKTRRSGPSGQKVRAKHITSNVRTALGAA